MKKNNNQDNGKRHAQPPVDFAVASEFLFPCRDTSFIFLFLPNIGVCVPFCAYLNILSFFPFFFLQLSGDKSTAKPTLRQRKEETLLETKLIDYLPLWQKDQILRSGVAIPNL